jgi:hypothetical protein
MAGSAPRARISHSMKSSRLAEIRALAEKHRHKNSRCVEMLLECVAEIAKLQQRRVKPSAPTMSEVVEFAALLGWNVKLAEEFFDRYEMVGWTYGRQRLPIVDFKAAMRHFKRNKDKFEVADKKNPGSSITRFAIG